MDGPDKETFERFGNMLNQKFYSEIDRWVNKHKICLFTKGCTNSTKMMDIINFYTKDKYFKLDVRHSDYLKNQLTFFSNEDTLPQLFVNGELVGDYHDVKKRHDEHELINTFMDKNFDFNVYN